MHSSIRRALGAAVILGAVAAGCGDDDDTATQPATEEAAATDEAAATEEPAATEEGAAASGDVLEVAAARTDVTTFLAALEASGIMEDFHGEGPFTLFIPNDAAFTAYIEASGMEQTEILGDPALLMAVLQNHVVEANDPSEMVMEMAGQAFTSAAGNELAVTVEGETVMINDATVLEYDVLASNGVIHIIDTVLVPPMDDAATEEPAATEEGAAASGDVLEVAAGRTDVTTFLAALEASGIMEDFHGEGPFTLFIPNDAAFSAYLAEAGMDETALLADPALLTTVLQNHVVEANDPSEMVMEMAGQAFTSAAGNELAVTVEGETVMINDATVLEYDLLASNGVIHIIDTVLVP